ncbi:MAG: hypothetical protein Q9190_006553 [Brigantiaea leucoxantha]
MGIVEIIRTSQPKARAQEVLARDGHNQILWDECRLIWDSTSLASADAREPEVSIYGALGSYTAAPDNKKHHFALRHYFEPESRGQYLVRLTATLADKGIHDQKVIDVKYQSEDSGDCQRVFEREVEEMTVSMRTGDVRTALENILGTQQQTRPAVNGVH